MGLPGGEPDWLGERTEGLRARAAEAELRLTVEDTRGRVRAAIERAERVITAARHTRERSRRIREETGRICRGRG